MTTYTIGGCNAVTVAKGRVVASESRAFPVGAVVTARRLRACGFKADKAARQYDAFGRVVR
jgi:hypothetical protein